MILDDSKHWLKFKKVCLLANEKKKESLLSSPTPLFCESTPQKSTHLYQQLHTHIMALVHDQPIINHKSKILYIPLLIAKLIRETRLVMDQVDEKR